MNEFILSNSDSINPIESLNNNSDSINNNNFDSNNFLDNNNNNNDNLDTNIPESVSNFVALTTNEQDLINIDSDSDLSDSRLNLDNMLQFNKQNQLHDNMDAPWDNSVKCGIELLDILNKTNAPKHLYNKIINWADTNKKLLIIIINCQTEIQLYKI